MHSRVTLMACAAVAVVVVFGAFAAGAPRPEKEPSSPDSAKPAAPPKTDKDPATGAAPGYTTKYDSIDVDQVLASKRLVNNYVMCLLDKKPCTPEGAELRKILPDALKTQCSKCNAKQKNTALKVVDRLQKDYDTEWKMLLDKWDPKREYLQSFQKYIEDEKKKGFKQF